MGLGNRILQERRTGVPPVRKSLRVRSMRKVGRMVVAEGTGKLQEWAEECRQPSRHPLRRAQGDGLDGLRASYAFTSTCSSYRLSFRYSVEGSIPSTSAARVLLPPSAWSTHMM